MYETADAALSALSSKPSCNSIGHRYDVCACRCCLQGARHVAGKRGSVYDVTQTIHMSWKEEAKLHVWKESRQRALVTVHS